MNNLPTVPCRVCTEPTTATAIKICAGCWAVESGLEGFLMHEEGRRIVEDALRPYQEALRAMSTVHDSVTVGEGDDAVHGGALRKSVGLPYEKDMSKADYIARLPEPAKPFTFRPKPADYESQWPPAGAQAGICGQCGETGVVVGGSHPHAECPRGHLFRISVAEDTGGNDS